MPKTMLIDAYHREETRVAVLQGGKVEDFDFEYASRKPLRGNIYLARVTRVEPSLQAAFIEYGGNRHGFLAFGEIHPDYYQIPVADREILRKAEALEVELAQKLAELNQNDDDDAIDPDDEDELRGRSDRDEDNQPEEASADASDDKAEEEPASPDFVPEEDGAEDGFYHAADEDLISAVGSRDEAEASDDDAKRKDAEEEEEEEERRTEEHGDDEEADADDKSAALEAEPEEALRSEDEAEAEASSEEPVAEADAEEEAVAEDETGDAEARADDEGKKAKPEPTAEELAARARQKEIDKLRSRYEEAKRDRNRLLRAYKIQEVIKRRQIMLVQVVKEERGNKGAALTTYLSLAGRYGVLMPNTARGGGISRKITSQSDRRRLKKAMSELDIAPNMGLIIRTAGAKRSKVEIKRDYDYLNRLWQTIRDKTLESVAPSLIYEEASLMKRAIRDLYDKDTEKVIVQGDEGYREAKDFMKMLMPSHAKHVQQHKGDAPLFLKHKVEEQLDGMYNPSVQLKSGGYIVIQQTEALVSIDVNSGKATKERNVEQTALKTNSEAAVEVARQCRLRDLAGLIVVDFIDMEENRNNRAVEKKLKDAMKNDRARTQIGSISSFGLLEMSRQRRRSGIVDGTTQACPVCEGAGAVRSHEMAAVRILRAAEGEAAAGKVGLVTVKTSTEVALYILNTKRAWLERMEGLYGVKTNILADSGRYGDQYEVTGSGTPAEGVSLKDTIGDDGPLSDFEAPELPGESAGETSSTSDEEGSEDKPKRRRRRRRRKGGAEDKADDQNEARSDENADEDGASEEKASEDKASEETKSDSSDDEDGEDKPKRRRRRGRRGGRRNRKSGEDGAEAGNDNDDASAETDTEDKPADDVSEADKAAAAAAVASTAAEAEAPEASEDAASAVSSEPEAADNVIDLDQKREASAEASEDAGKEPAPAEAEEAPMNAEAEAQAEADETTDVEEAEEAAASKIDRTDTPADPSKPRKVGWWSRAFQKD
ncbi:Rne/Rng family ribonuclease [Parvularcula sp. ZS-1/3]|uniref:Ribonuclease E n=1 Tax=Parvularcula mediterranea TaxID=2732508 RepID=A0A7Y3RJ77_9PROT|nr:ribonuclease E/G [Parvularcula mediterranea]NNU15031.1 Rne/Rng family ribonuclease [Parvularcula mediterranea]